MSSKHRKGAGWAEAWRRGGRQETRVGGLKCGLWPCILGLCELSGFAARLGATPSAAALRTGKKHVHFDCVKGMRRT